MRFGDWLKKKSQVPYPLPADNSEIVGLAKSEEKEHIHFS
jgi:hypothetical protein